MFTGLTLETFPWMFALIVGAITFGIAYVIAHTESFSVGEPTLGDTLVAWFFTSGPVGAFLVWGVWHGLS